jgi:hypothetical protein
MKSIQYGRTIATAVAGIFALTMSVANAREVVTQQPMYTGPAQEAAPSAEAKRAAVANQVSIINQMADKFQSEAASQFRGNFDALEWRLAFGARLFHQSEEALTAGLAAADTNAMIAKMASASMAKHNGSLQNTVNLLPNPCRIVDTRFGGGGQLGPVSRFWYAFNTPAIIAAQGGNAAGCGNFPTAEFFLVYVTAVPPGAPLSGGAGFLTLQHDGGVPTTSTMNFNPGINIANFAAVSCNGCGGPGAGSGGFNAFASNPTHVVIDLVGVGAPTAVTLWASVDSTGVIDRCFGCTSTGTSKLGTGVYEIAFTRDITNCGFSATVGTPNVSAANGITGLSPRAGNANALFVQTFSVAGAAADRPYYASVFCP